MCKCPFAEALSSGAQRPEKAVVTGLSASTSRFAACLCMTVPLASWKIMQRSSRGPRSASMPLPAGDLNRPSSADRARATSNPATAGAPPPTRSLSEPRRTSLASSAMPTVRARVEHATSSARALIASPKFRTSDSPSSDRRRLPLSRGQRIRAEVADLLQRKAKKQADLKHEHRGIREQLLACRQQAGSCSRKREILERRERAILTEQELLQSLTPRSIRQTVTAEYDEAERKEKADIKSQFSNFRWPTAKETASFT